MTRKSIVWFEEVGKENIPLVGGKGANLGEMTRAGFPIPYGFIVTSQAYYNFLDETGLRPKIEKYLQELDYKDNTSLVRVSDKIQELIIESSVPERLAEQIASYYEQLYEHEAHTQGVAAMAHRIKATYKPALVAIRSSATAEDLPDASFAGQQETYLNVQGESHVIRQIKACWASLFTQRAIFYRSEKNFDHFKVGLAAVVQRMVQSDTSGIMFTVDPVTNNKKMLVIEAIFGLGEYIVQGKVTPDQYLVTKGDFKIHEKRIGTQEVRFVKRGAKNVEYKLTRREGSQQKITDKQIVEVARVGHAIEKHYYFPQDIEWAYEKEKLFITQARPITTLHANQGKQDDVTVSHDVIAKGDSASPGIASGPVVKLRSPKEIGTIKDKDVLVAQQTNPDYVPAMKKASAIITERGGRTSHAAIVSRELGIPCVVGVDNAMSLLKEQELVTVNGSSGEVLRGVVKRKEEKGDERVFNTKTKIYLNLGEPELAKKVSAIPADGIGLLRAEFMIANLGEHPAVLLKRGKGSVFTKHLAEGISTIAKAFYPRPVVYRTTDFKTNEYRFLKGGREVEPHEENPLIGYRGAYRYTREPEVFALEVEALKKVRESGLNNVHVMVPFVRTPQHLAQTKHMIEEHGMKFGKDFKFWMMVELPVNVLLLDSFLDVGVDGISIGSNDLTMLMLGIDRDNEILAHLYDERNEAVLWALKKTIQTCASRGVTASICGQSVSDYPEMLEFVVRAGITSVSVSPDAFTRVNQQVHALELHGSHR
ncbi:MAG: phosphoenolpyruvate synthase [Candidatus Roizmanbacteria bacterium]|nr:phosphoenolpyruvate synthase [Candidatus Roizmanbacteria bacterium]